MSPSRLLFPPLEKRLFWPLFLLFLQKYRLLLLFSFFLALIASHIGLIAMALQARPVDEQSLPYLLVWYLSFVPYLLASLVLLTTKPASKKQQWYELVFIVGGGMMLRLLLVWLPPNLSHDSWRYVWDARVTLQGFSPYVTVPGDPALAHLRDFIFANSRFRNVPTIYPPGAQLIYLLTYLLAPSNLFVLKGVFLFFELLSCVLLMLILGWCGLDRSRCLLYAWCPLPIVEIAMQGHLDVLLVTCLLVLICCLYQRPARVLLGFLIAVATLIKLYPALLLLAVLKDRRDWRILVTFVLTIAGFYLPYVWLGHGQVFGFFATYANEYGTNGGPVVVLSSLIAQILPLSLLWLRLCLSVLVLGGICLLVVVRYRRAPLTSLNVLLLLLGSFFLLSPHVFPWYTIVLLPFVVLGLQTDLTRPWTVQTSISLWLWYFICMTPSGYLGGMYNNWLWYYLLVYLLPLAGMSFTLIFPIVKKSDMINVLRGKTDISVRK